MQTSIPVAIVMGSQSDWATLLEASTILRTLDIESHAEIVSAHRTPRKMFDFASEAMQRGFRVIIAGAGGAAHLPGMIAALTPLPVLGVPVRSAALNGIDSLLSIAQMPRGVAVGTLAIGTAGAFNAGLLAAQILALGDSALMQRLIRWREERTQLVLDNPYPEGAAK
jgi:5-(carboxyamino)imidazole ribonucleotide mutase